MSRPQESKRRKVDGSISATYSVEDASRPIHDDDLAPADPKESTNVSKILPSDGKYRNKQRCLVLCSRGVTSRYRHLLEDIRTLLPHHKKESKLDPGKEGIGQAVNDIAELRSCNTVLFLECRKHTDCYLWISRTAAGGTTVTSTGADGVARGGAMGPSVRFLVTNIHTMDELRLTGNCLKGSRPVLSFDKSFTEIDHLKLIKELFIDVFGVPRGHPKSKPFVDRVMSFYFADNRVSLCLASRLIALGSVDDFKNDERMSDQNHFGVRSTTILFDYDGMRHGTSQ
jgi:ribosome biogenesis protein BRX1